MGRGATPGIVAENKNGVREDENGTCVLVLAGGEGKRLQPFIKFLGRSESRSVENKKSGRERNDRYEDLIPIIS
jgi:hypothetical protein